MTRPRMLVELLQEPVIFQLSLSGRTFILINSSISSTLIIKLMEYQCRLNACLFLLSNQSSTELEDRGLHQTWDLLWQHCRGRSALFCTAALLPENCTVIFSAPQKYFKQVVEGGLCHFMYKSRRWALLCLWYLCYVVFVCSLFLSLPFKKKLSLGLN